MPERGRLLHFFRGREQVGQKSQYTNQFTLLFNGNKSDEIIHKHTWGNFLLRTVNKFKLNLTEGEHLVSEVQILKISRKQAAEEREISYQSPGSEVL